MMGTPSFDIIAVELGELGERVAAAMNAENGLCGDEAIAERLDMAGREAIYKATVAAYAEWGYV